MAKIIDFITRFRRKYEAKRFGVPFRTKEWYNLRAMLGKDDLSKHRFIEIFDESKNYIECPGVGGEVILSYYGQRFRYRVIGFENESPYKDWLYDSDYINPIIEYIAKEE